MNSRAAEMLLAYEWRVAQQYLESANCNQQQAYRDLLTALEVTTDPLRRTILLNVGLWMQRNWPIRREVGSEGGERDQRRQA